MKTLKSILLIAVLLFCETNLTLAQKPKENLSFFDLINVNEAAFRADDFYDKSVVFSINIGINKLGRVDTVIYSGNDDVLINRLFDLKKITKGLKANQKDFKTYKNEFAVIMVMATRGDENFIEIKNGNQNLAQWKAISEKNALINKMGRRQVLLSPVLFYSRGKSIQCSIGPVNVKK